MEAINGMGDKLESKRLAQAAGVNTIPGENYFSSPCIYNYLCIYLIFNIIEIYRKLVVLTVVIGRLL